MGKESFLLLFVLGAAAIAAWIALRLPELAPTSFRGRAGQVAAALGAGGGRGAARRRGRPPPAFGGGPVHLVAARVVGAVLGPAVRAVPGLPSELSVLAALFLVALPALPHMLLVWVW